MFDGFSLEIDHIKPLEPNYLGKIENTIMMTYPGISEHYIAVGKMDPYNYPNMSYLFSIYEDKYII